MDLKVTTNEIELVEMFKKDSVEDFKTKMGNFIGDITVILNLLNDQEKEEFIKCCRKVEIYFLHRLFTTVEPSYSLQFITNNLPFYSQHILDKDRRTWLHVAVSSNRDIEILKFLINDVGINVESLDRLENTPLHLACQKMSYNRGETNLLIKTPELLITAARNEMTPLELACQDVRKLKEIQTKKTVRLDNLLKNVDNLTTGVPQTEDFYLCKALSIENCWWTLLHKNDKYRLFYTMKKDTSFKEKYYLETDIVLNTLEECNENGQGVMTHIKNHYFDTSKPRRLIKIFEHLSRLKVSKCDSQNTKMFHNSALFLALITGRFELVPPLLSYCQFDIIPYGLVVCLICQTLSTTKGFQDQDVNSFKNLKDECESYCIKVLNRTSIHDLSMKKKQVTAYLNNAKFLKKTILDIAYHAKCRKFLSLLPCQAALNDIWHARNNQCPEIKFWLHSLAHCIFLSLFTHVLVAPFDVGISGTEIICYTYGVGYFVEETKQIYVMKKMDFLKFYIQDSNNILDFSALIFMLLGSCLHLCVVKNPTEEFSTTYRKEGILFSARLILCMSFIAFSMRIIYCGAIFKQVGPKLKMISKMIYRDLLPLLFIFTGFIFAFGVTFQSLLYPRKSNNSTDNDYNAQHHPVSDTIKHIFRRATYTIFDSFYINDELNGHEVQIPRDERGNVAVHIFLIIYIIVVNVMLMNLLIALFSYSVTEIIERSTESWRANRYKVIKEYSLRSLLFPPFNIFEMIFNSIRSRCLKHKIKAKLLNRPSDIENHHLIDIEDNVQDTPYFHSFQILQAYAMKGWRYKLLHTETDRLYEIQMELKLLHRKLDGKLK